MLNRLFKLALIDLLPPEKLREINKQARSTIIDPDSNSEEKVENSAKEDSKIEVDTTLIF